MRKKQVKEIKREEKPKFVQEMLKTSELSVGSLDDYITQYERWRDFTERLNEISEELYELMEMQLEFEKDFKHVWAVPTDYENYLTCGVYAKLYATSNVVRNKIDHYIERNKLNGDNVPDIPIMEYMLVPTGNVEAYHAFPNMKEMNRERNTIRQREWDWKKRVFNKQDEKYKERKERYNEEKRSETNG